LDSDYETCLLGFNEESDYFISGKKTRGIIRGVDGFGRLLVQIPDQGLVVFNHNEIGFSR
jgi:biotin-(acetyl-CoA carboxylase) ligase